jgi:hypothetical protein
MPRLRSLIVAAIVVLGAAGGTACALPVQHLDAPPPEPARAAPTPTPAEPDEITNDTRTDLAKPPVRDLPPDTMAFAERAIRIYGMFVFVVGILLAQALLAPWFFRRAAAASDRIDSPLPPR